MAGREYILYSMGGAAFAFIGFIFIYTFGSTMNFVPGGVLVSAGAVGRERILRAVYVLAVLGFGMSFVMMNLATFGMEKLEGIQKTDGTALMTCLRTIGGALGAAGFVSLMSVGVTDSNYTIANVRHSYVGMVILAAVCVVLAFGFIKREK